MEQHDWIIANLNNPDFTVSDFQYIGDMNLENTQLLSKDYYNSNSYITEHPKFKDDNGQYSPDKFNDFYNSQTSTFQEFSEQSQLNQLEYDMFDANRPKDAPVKDIHFSIGNRQNPMRNSIGIEGIGIVTDSGKSIRELAQDAEIIDSRTGKSLGYTLNDVSLFSNPEAYIDSIFGEPLVYATYDEDTEEIDPETGNKILRKKGEYKLNEKGEFYIETLGDRSSVGKQVVSAFDYITPEDSMWNNYDFFDSDDLEKSIGGSIMKTIVTLAPLMIPGVNTAYSGILIGRELLKAAPMLYSQFTLGQESLLLNELSAQSKKFTTSVSDYAQQNLFSFENFAGLMGDVALQWGQQNLIARSFTKLSGGKQAVDIANAKAKLEYKNRAEQLIKDVRAGKKTSEEASKLIGVAEKDFDKITATMLETGAWENTRYGMSALSKYIPNAQKIASSRAAIGRDLALSYMAIVSNTDVYESILNHGGTKQEAAAIAFGSMLGMFSVDKYLGLGELFFDDDVARKAFRNVARESADELQEQVIGKEFKKFTPTKKGIFGQIQKGIDLGKNAVKNYNSKLKDLIGKSLGEGLEEVSEELVADVSKTLGEIAGQLGVASQTDYGSWEGGFDKYLMSFLGGAAGGGLYGIINSRTQFNQLQNDLIYLIRQGYKDDIIKEIDKLKKKGKLGSTTLSTTLSEDKKTFLTAESEKDSQASYIYNTLIKTINQLDLILNGTKTKIDDDELFDHMVQGEYKAAALTDWLKGDSESIKNISYITKYQQDYQILLNKIAQKEIQIQELLNSNSDPNKRNDATFQNNLEVLEAEKEELLKEKDYLFGEGSLGYVQKTLFAIDPRLSGRFVAMNKHQFARNYFGKHYTELTQAEKDKFNNLYAAYSQVIKGTLDEAFKKFIGIQNAANDLLYAQVKLNSNRETSFKPIGWNDKLDNETEEEYNNRNQQENESDENFKKRQEIRLEKINDQNIKNIIDFSRSETISSHNREFLAKTRMYYKDLIDNIISKFNVNIDTESEYGQLVSKILTPEFNKEVQTLISQIQDREIVLEKINELITSRVEDYLKQNKYDNTVDTLSTLREGDFPREGLWATKQDFVNYVDSVVEWERNNGNPEFTAQDLFNQLEEEFEWEFNPTTIQGKLNLEAIEYYNSLKELENSPDTDVEKFNELLEQGSEPMEINSSFIRREASGIAEDIYKQYTDALYKLVFDVIDNDDTINALRAIDIKATLGYNTGFLGPVLKAMHQHLHGDSDPNEILDNIYSQFLNSDGYNNFELTRQQEELLKQIMEDLDMLEVVIYAAANKNDFESLVEHNKALNEFVENHKDVFKNYSPLVVLKEGNAPVLLNDIAQYKREITSWLNAHYSNSSDKSEKQLKADQALVSAQLTFYEINRKYFKVNPDIDLLEGYEELELEKDLVSLVKVQELIHLNYEKHKNNISIKEILETVIPNITNVDELITQKTAKLDENLTYKDLTSYDKFTIFVNNLALDSINFYSNLKTFLVEYQDIAPLAIQEHAAKTAFAMVENPEIVNSALDYLKNLIVDSGKNIPILPNTTILLGVAGSGKTDAIVRLIAKDGSNSWYSGPTQTQIDNLNTKLPKGEAIEIDKLLELALGSNWTEISEPTSNSNDKKVNAKYWKKVKAPNGDNIVVLNDSVKVNKIDKSPKYIIIDEATHISSAKLQIISKFAKENNINLILLGDDTQNGYTEKDIQYNLEKEYAIAWRSPKLFISLRDNNLQKVKNLRSCLNILNKFEDANSEEEMKNLGKELIDQFLPNLSFSYYLNDGKFFGELITDEISNEIIEALKKGSVGFVGDESSEYYQQLVKAGITPKKILNSKKVQGEEFDYVIIDRNDWPNSIISEDLFDSAVDIHNFIKDVYTMMSRSRKGSVLIDKGLSQFIKNTKDSVSGETSPIKDSAEIFRKKRLSQIQEIEKLREFFKTSEKEPEPKNEEDDKGSIGSSTIKEIEKSLKNNGEIPGVTTNEKVIKEEDQKKEIDVTNTNTPIRVYGNISLSGLDISGNTVENDNNSTRDLGIFIKPGKSIKKSKLGDEVEKLLKLKSIILYSDFDHYDRLGSQITKEFSKESLEQAKYFIKVDDVNPTNHLIGLTDLKQDKLPINGKVISLIAKIVGKDGITYSITLGNLADPATWERNKEDNIKSIQKRIENNDPESEYLKQYIENLHKYIDNYKDYISNIAQTNQEIELSEKPELSGMTELVSLGHNIRIENINDDKRPWKSKAHYAVSSPIYLVQEDIPGVSPNVKGRAVMYVSHNMLLNPSELESLYLQQKNNPELIPQVRMIVLNNEGVSFESLRREKYKDIYKGANTDISYSLPFKSEIVAIGMYVSLWNFRANLKTFLEFYTSWRDQNNLTDEEVEELCNLDNETYNSIKGDEKYLDEATYRQKVSKQLQDKLKIIWDFNDSLSESVRQFRLGYNAENGTYIRNLTNLKEGGFYKDLKDAQGIYINPTLAQQYEKVLDILFENVINKIIPSESKPYNVKDILTINKFKKWFDQVHDERSVQFTIYEGKSPETKLEDHTEIKSIELPSQNMLERLTTILIQISKNLEIRGFDPTSFDEYRIDRNSEGLSDKFNISIGDESIDYISLWSAFENGQQQTIKVNLATNENFSTGMDTWKTSDGDIYLIDKRLDNLFSLAFHGLTSTKVENDLSRSEMRATDAIFKFGFKIHPTYLKQNGETMTNAPIATNSKLFSANVKPGFPLVTIFMPKFKQQEVTSEIPDISTYIKYVKGNDINDNSKDIYSWENQFREYLTKLDEDQLNVKMDEIEKQLKESVEGSTEYKVYSFLLELLQIQKNVLTKSLKDELLIEKQRIFEIFRSFNVEHEPTIFDECKSVEEIIEISRETLEDNYEKVFINQFKVDLYNFPISLSDNGKVILFTDKYPQLLEIKPKEKPEWIKGVLNITAETGVTYKLAWNEVYKSVEISEAHPTIDEAVASNETLSSETNTNEIASNEVAASTDETVSSNETVSSTANETQSGININSLTESILKITNPIIKEYPDFEKQIIKVISDSLKGTAPTSNLQDRQIQIVINKVQKEISGQQDPTDLEWNNTLNEINQGLTALKNRECKL